MSPENQGVFQLLKVVTFLIEIWDFATYEDRAILRVFVCGLVHITL